MIRAIEPVLGLLLTVVALGSGECTTTLALPLLARMVRIVYPILFVIDGLLLGFVRTSRPELKSGIGLRPTSASAAASGRLFHLLA